MGSLDRYVYISGQSTRSGSRHTRLPRAFYWLPQPHVARRGIARQVCRVVDKSDEAVSFARKRSFIKKKTEKKRKAGRAWESTAVSSMVALVGLFTPSTRYVLVIVASGFELSSAQLPSGANPRIQRLDLDSRCRRIAG